MESTIKYKIPVRAISSDGTLRCTVPSRIVRELRVKQGDDVVWILHSDSSLTIEIIHSDDTT